MRYSDRFTFDLSSPDVAEKIMVSVIALLSLCLFASPENQQPEPDLPRASSVHGRYVPADLSPFSTDVQEAIARAENIAKPPTFDPATIREFSLKKATSLDGANQNPVVSFKQMISGVPVGGSLQMVKPHVIVPPEYLRTIEQLIRLNLSLPIYARNMTSTTTVAYTFTVLHNGQITDFDKERTTGSPALDNVVQNALRSISPLESPRGIVLTPENTSQPLARLRFSLTYRPGS